MVRSRCFFTQNKLYLFLTASVAVHILILAGIKIDLSPAAEIVLPEYRISLRTVKVSEPVHSAILSDPAEYIFEPAVQEAVDAPAVPAAEPVITVQTDASETVSADVPAEPAAEPALESIEKPPIIFGQIGKVSAAGSSPMASAQTDRGGEGADFVSFDALDVPGVNLPGPQYPDLARRWGHEGTAVVEILVAEDGSIRNFRLIKSSGFDELDDAVRNVVLNKWRFMRQENEIKTRKEFVFRLREG